MKLKIKRGIRIFDTGKNILLIAILGLVMSIFFQTPVHAQSQPDFASIDKKSYDAYMIGDWQEVLYQGKLAKKAGIDYYYLNYRLGIASFQTNDYLNAIYFFEKAITQNSFATTDTTLIRTLYKSYIYTKNLKGADAIKKHHPDSIFRQRKHCNFLKQIYLEGGFSFSENITDKVFKERRLYYFKEIDQFQDQSYYSADVQGYIHPSVSYQIGFTGMEIGRYRFYKNFLDTLENDYKVKQTYLFFGLNFDSKRFYINPSINFSGFTFNTVQKTGNDPITLINIFDTMNVEENNLTFSMRSGYKFKKAFIGLLASYSDFNQTTQTQLGTELIFFPLGNYRTYLVTNIVGHWEEGVANLLFRQKIGFRTSPWLWLEMDLKLGKYINSSMDNGYYVYNVKDDIRGIVDLKIILLLSEQLELNIVLQQQFKENYMNSYPAVFDQTIESTSYQFQQYNLIGGIKWTF
ncbi:MAG: hypothetical protein JXR34_10195 [Bacteroidales bacterium]|nr:hypothetical protein [Bacteroidales bacterium]